MAQSAYQPVPDTDDPTDLTDPISDDELVGIDLAFDPAIEGIEGLPEEDAR